MKIPSILVVPIYILILVAVCFGVYGLAILFGARTPQAWGFFTGAGVILALALFTWGRQIYWRITKTGDYSHLKNKEKE